MNQGPRSLSYSLLGNVVLVCLDFESGSYEFYLVPKDSFGKNDTTHEAKRGLGGSVVFVACNQFEILDKSHNQVMIQIS